MGAGQAWFEEFFVEGNYAAELAAIPAERTARETAFIESALALRAEARILDLCCGVGRHAVALAQRGFRVAGLDLNPEALRVAEETARAAGVPLVLHHSDMRTLPYRSELDAVINIFTSLGYYESDSEDQLVLAEVAKALKLGGKFLLDTANREGILRNYEERVWQEMDDGTIVVTNRLFDLLTGRQRVTHVSIALDGARSERGFLWRMYSLSELARMLDDVGMAVEQTWGGFDGSEYGLRSRRMIVLARKRA